jgi:hypothetical protein
MILFLHERRKFFLALIAIIIAVVLIAVLKRFGGIKAGRIGPELNLFTYGYLGDTFIKAMNKEKYWPQFPPEFDDVKIWVLFILATANLVLMGYNFKLDSTMDHLPSSRRKNFRRVTMIASGIVSLVIFFECKMTFGE